MPQPCPVCDLTLTAEPKSIPGTATEFDCPNCGRWRMTKEDEGRIPWSDVRSPEKIGVLSHSIRMRQSSGQPVVIRADDVAKILQHGRPSPAEMLDLLLQLIASRQPAPGIFAPVDLINDMAAIGAGSAETTRWAMQSLQALGRIEANYFGAPTQEASLTLPGWIQHDQLEKGRAVSRRVFMAMKFGEPSLDVLYHDHLRKAVAATGFELYRLDEDPAAGLIDVRLRVELRRARLLIADLTHGNPGAYWEAGFMEGLGKPVIYLCEASVFHAAPTHFDINHSQHVLWSATDPGACCGELKATIRATLAEEARMDDPV